MNIVKRPSLLLLVGYIILAVTFVGAVAALVYLRTNWEQTLIDIVNANGGLDGQKLTIDGIKNSTEMINMISELMGQKLEVPSYEALKTQGDSFFSMLLVGGIIVYGGVLVLATLGLFNKLFKLFAGILSLFTGIGIIGGIIYLAGKNK